MERKLQPSGCENSDFCEKYAGLEPLRRLGIPSKCPFAVVLTKEIEVLGELVPEGKRVCVESMQLLIPDLPRI